ncbi:MAG: hypothetical protein HY420_00475 [Candidatus Kerfeldbacteria bacterium]|nr:hypothetical protein [Candidatus Kerfeldbacteria bacterium]
MASEVEPELERSILATLAYFDVFDYPLRVEEVWQWLYAVGHDEAEVVKTAQPVDVHRGLNDLVKRGVVDRAGSFVMLPGRSAIVATRMARKAACQRKWRRARFVSSLLRFVPFVRFVGVVNTLAIDNAKPESDIDFFIIVKSGRIWMTRAAVTLLVHTLGIRRHGNRVTNRVCLSLYMSDGNLSMERYSLEQSDPYLTFWSTQVVPLFDRGGTWEQFRRANIWVMEKIPNGFAVTPAPFRGDLVMAKLWRGAWEWLLGGRLGNALERVARFLQLKFMERKRQSRRLRPTTDVVVNDEIMKFHEQDRRQYYRDAFRQRLVRVTG